MRFSRHRRTTLAKLVGLAILVLPLTVQAATFHVSPFGSNIPPYNTYATAAHNVADAVEATSGAGDTVLIHAGEYDVDTTINLPNGVTLAGVGRDSVSLVWHKLPGTANNWMFFLLGNNEVVGVEFVNPLGTFVDPWSMSMLMDEVNGQGYLLVHDSRFNQLGLSASSYWDREIFQNEFLVWSTYASIQSIQGNRLLIHDNYFYGGIRASGGTGILLTGGDVQIERNVFDFSQTMRSDPIVVDRYPVHVTVRNNLIVGGRVPMFWSTAPGVIENNTIIGPENPDADFNIYLAADNSLLIRNNVFQDFPGGPRIAQYPSGSFTLVHNVFWPPTTAYVRIPASFDSSLFTIEDSTNISAHPMFASDTTGGVGWTSFRLQRGSPLIDAGASYLMDVDGTTSDVGWTGGPGGVSYDYLESPPSAPESLRVTGNDQVVTVTWSSRPEADLHSYRVYRSTTSGSWEPGLTPYREISAPDTSICDTLLAAGVSYYYVCTAVDTAMLESQPSPEGEYTVTGVDDTPESVTLPRTPYIARVYPNPSNATVTLDVVIPEVGAMPAPVRIALYDVSGRFVAVAFEGHLNAGTSSIQIPTSTSHGATLASGVYFARLKVWNTEFGPTRKLVLVK